MDKKVIAFVVFPELTALDLIGPLQVLKPLENFGPFEVVTVGARVAPVATDVGLQIVPERTFDEVPRPFALLVPGGAVGPIKALLDEAIMGYLRSAGEAAEVVGSVCTGSLLLAGAGLLEGRRATTHWCFLEQLGKLGAVPVRERWVEDGKLITSAGVASGIDMALALAARLAGADVARIIQTIIEYDPKPPFGGIDWAWVEQAGVRGTLMASLGSQIQQILAGRPDLLAKLS